MKFLLPSIDHLKSEMIRVFQRFPLTALITTLTTLLLFYLIETKSDIEKNQTLLDAVLVLFLGFPLTISCQLIAEKKPNWLKLPTGVVSYLALIPMVLFYSWRQKQTGDGESIRYLQWALYSHLLVAFAPFLGASRPGALWNFNYRIFISFLISRFFSAALWTGLALAVTAVSSLLEIRVETEFYGHLAAICLVWIGTLHFLALVPLKPMENKEEQPRLLKVFCQYILVPLNVLYLVILYAYMVKILATGHWPSGMIGWLVVGVSILGVFALLMMETFFDQPENKWMKSFQFGYYLSIVPLLLMGLVSMGFRIHQYSLTEKRYLLLALSLWLIGIAVYNLASKKRNILIIPVSLFAVTFLTSFGPWGLYQVSWRSQAHRLESLLQKYETIQNGEIVKNVVKFSERDAAEIKELLTYLLRDHGGNRLPDFFSPADREILKRISGMSKSELSNQVEIFLQSKLNFPAQTKSVFALSTMGKSFHHSKVNSAVFLKPDILLISFQASDPRLLKAENQKEYRVSVNTDDLILLLTESGREMIRWNLKPEIERIRKEAPESADQIWKFSNAEVEATLIPERVQGNFDGSNIHDFEIKGQLLVRFLK